MLGCRLDQVDGSLQWEAGICVILCSGSTQGQTTAGKDRMEGLGLRNSRRTYTLSKDICVELWK